MTRARIFVGALLAAILTAAALAASASATTYQLRGYEVMLGSDSGTFLGFVEVNGTSAGFWSAIINHAPLEKHPHAVTQITPLSSGFVLGSGFTFTWGSAIAMTGAQYKVIQAGTVVAGPVVRGQQCMQDFQVTGSLVGGGTFKGTLTHLGTRDRGSCDAELAIFRGWVEFP